MRLIQVILGSYLVVGVISWYLVIRYFPPTPLIRRSIEVPPVSTKRKASGSGILGSVAGVCIMIAVSPAWLTFFLIQIFRSRARE
jgi:hypothetical protein